MKFKTYNLVIKNNSSLSIEVLQKNVIYQFKCPLGDCNSENNNIYAGLTASTLSRRLTMLFSDIISMAQHLKKNYLCPSTELWKFLLKTEKY